MSRTARGTLIGTAICMVALTLAYAPVAATGAETVEEPADPVEIALSYVEANPDALGVTDADVDDLAVASSYRSSHNGVTHVNVNQRFDGLEVFGTYTTDGLVETKISGVSSYQITRVDLQHCEVPAVP